MAMDENQMMALFAGSMSLVSILISLAIAVVMIIANWKIFTKAGEEGWKCIIPFYNMYTQYKFTWNTKMFWIMFGLSLACIIPLLGFVAAIAVFVINIMALNKLAKSFGKGTGFTVGLIFLNAIFLLILGFGDAEYQGADL